MVLAHAASAWHGCQSAAGWNWGGKTQVGFQAAWAVYKLTWSTQLIPHSSHHPHHEHFMLCTCTLTNKWIHTNEAALELCWSTLPFIEVTRREQPHKYNINISITLIHGGSQRIIGNLRWMLETQAKYHCTQQEVRNLFLPKIVQSEQ